MLLMAAAVLPACSSEQTTEITSPALVSKVTQYYADAGTDELTWTEVSSSEYQYENGYPTALTRTAYDEVTAISTVMNP